MDDEILSQARQLHHTIRALQQRLAIRNLRIDSGGKLPTRELTLAQLTTLRVIHERGQVNLKELAEATRVSSPSASAMVDRLTDLGLAMRQSSATDRREVRIGLTPEGTNAVEHCERELLHSLIEILQQLGSETSSRWCAVYEQIQGILDEENAATEAVLTR
jgi:DNA-binding MarR family transcriptional regulator